MHHGGRCVSVRCVCDDQTCATHACIHTYLYSRTASRTAASRVLTPFHPFSPPRKLLVYLGFVFAYMLLFAGISMPLLETDYGTSLYFTTVTFSTMGKN